MMRSRRRKLSGYELNLRFFCRVCILIVSVALLGLTVFFATTDDTVEHEFDFEFYTLETTDGKENGAARDTEAEIDIGC